MDDKHQKARKATSEPRAEACGQAPGSLRSSAPIVATARWRPTFGKVGDRESRRQPSGCPFPEESRGKSGTGKVGDRLPLFGGNRGGIGGNRGESGGIGDRARIKNLYPPNPKVTGRAAVFKDTDQPARSSGLILNRPVP